MHKTVFIPIPLNVKVFKTPNLKDVLQLIEKLRFNILFSMRWILNINTISAESKSTERDVLCKCFKHKKSWHAYVNVRQNKL